MKKGSLSVFGNYHRLKILSCLVRCDLDVQRIVHECGISQSAVSQHLKKIREAGLVSSRREGRRRIYQLSDKDAGKISVDLLHTITKKPTNY
jgi:DNA-binding transcriptional ArsR family regulator